MGEGVASFKLFMAYPGVLMVDDATIFKALSRTAKNGALICMHAENGSVIDVIVARALAEGKTAPIYHALTRPTRAEAEAVHRAIAMAEIAGAPVYIVHLSSEDALNQVREARDRGVPAFAETCPQYLLLSIEELARPGFEGAKYVFTPPLREEASSPKLWDGLKHDHLQVVSTDHCPFCFEDQKVLGKDDFTKIPNGGPGIENRLQLIYHHGVNQGKLSLNRFVELTSTTPARIFGMYPRKGEIAPGSDADIVVWDPQGRPYHQRADASHARRLLDVRRLRVKGNARTVLSRGEVIVDGGRWLGKAGPRQLSEARGARRRVEVIERRIPRLYNEDLAPIPSEQRTWGLYNYASLWVAMSVCIPTYMLASGLIAGGMSWWQAIGTILLGNLIVLIPMLLNAHAGTKYGIPFPVFVRASFGVRGANIPAVLRALVACGWFGIQTWIGGQAIYSMLKIIWPGRGADVAGGIWICFFAFWALNMAVIWRGIDTIKFLEGIGAPFMLAVGLLLLWWITRQGRRLRPGSQRAEQVPHHRGVLPLLHPVAHRHGRLLGHRRAEHPGLHALRQIAKGAGAGAGSRTARRHDALLLHRRRRDLRVGGALRRADLGSGGTARQVQPAGGRLHRAVALLIATLNTNVAANVVSPSNDFSNLNPRRISFRTGGLITGVIGVLMMPWKLLSDFSAYIFGWLVGYSGLLGPIAGVMIADYFLVRRSQLECRRPVPPQRRSTNTTMA